MSLRGRFFAATYDRQMKKSEKAGLTALRARLLAQAAGRVLEIGGGTGANLAHYGPAVESLTITEPEVPMLQAPGAPSARRGTRRRWCCGPPLRTSPSRTTPSTSWSRRWCSAVSTTSPGRCGRSVGCWDPRAASSSWSTCVRPTPRWQRSRTA